MNNEELAVSAQQGDKRALYDLWENIQKLMYMLCYQTYHSLPQEYTAQKGVTLDDMKQESYFAFLQAVKGYKSDQEYKFTSYINYALKNSINDLLGNRANKNEPLNHCDSLNVPLGDDNDTERLDTIQDPTTQVNFDSVIDKEYNEELHQALDKAMQEQCTDREKQILNMRYYENKTQKDISNVLGVAGSRIGQLEHKAYRNLRQGRAVKILEPYRLESLAYSLNSSFGSWKSYGSIEERVIEKLEDFRAKFNLKNVL